MTKIYYYQESRPYIVHTAVNCVNSKLQFNYNKKNLKGNPISYNVLNTPNATENYLACKTKI